MRFQSHETILIYQERQLHFSLTSLGVTRGFWSRFPVSASGVDRSHQFVKIKSTRLYFPILFSERRIRRRIFSDLQIKEMQHQTSRRLKTRRGTTRRRSGLLLIVLTTVFFLLLKISCKNAIITITSGAGFSSRSRN